MIPPILKQYPEKGNKTHSLSYGTGTGLGIGIVGIQHSI